MVLDRLGADLTLASFRRDLGDYPAELGNLALFARLDSTNAMARRVAAAYLGEALSPPPAVVAALQQTSGRGRLGRPWVSPAGQGVYLSLLRVLAEAEEAVLYPLLVGVGLCNALNRWLGGRCRLKWPNDLVVGGRKIGGILIESVGSGDRPVLVAGFGVNLIAPTSSEAPAATGLRQEAEVRPSLGELAGKLLDAVALELRRAGDPAHAIAAYEGCTIHRPGESLRCRTAEGIVEGRFLGFDARGFLRLDDGRGERRLAAGDLIG